MIGIIAEIILVRFEHDQRPCWICNHSAARWAVFQSHADYVAAFDPATSVYVAACDRCVTVAQRQDPEGHNYIRSLCAYSSLLEWHPVIVPVG